MIDRCCVIGCNKERYAGCGIPFHRLPSDNNIKEKWIKAIPGKLTKSSMICSLHFKPEDYHSPILKILKSGVIPSIFPQVQKLSEASTCSVAAGDRSRFNTEESISTSLIVYSDEEPSEQDDGDTDQIIHYISSKESQKGRMRLSGGAGSAGILLSTTALLSLQQELLMDLHEINDKIQSLHPTVLGKQFTLTFKGVDGDRSEYVFMSASDTRRSGERHGGLSCGECGSDVIGFRYTCVSCAEYDLCSACEALGKHPHHLMMRIAKPLKLKQARSLLQHWCEVMKTVGVDTAEEITGAPDTSEPDTPDPDTREPDTPKPGTSEPRADPALNNASPRGDPVYISRIHEDGPANTKDIRTKILKDQVETSTQPPKSVAVKRKVDTPEEDSDAKKTKIVSSESATERDVLPVKEDSLDFTDLANYYSSFSETEPMVQVEQVKVEDPDPLSTDDMVKTEDIQDTSLAPVPMEDSSSALRSPLTANCVKTYTHDARIPHPTEEEQALTCTCGIKFTLKKNLYAHMRKFHASEWIQRQEEKKNKKFKCTCGMTYMQKKNLYSHMRKRHALEWIQLQEKKFKEKEAKIKLHNKSDHTYASAKMARMLCPDAECGYKFQQHSTMLKHMSREHDLQVEIQQFTFQSISEFQKWKNNMEEETTSSYTRCSAIKKLRDGMQKIYYQCTNSNNSSKTQRSQNMLSDAISKSCPSRLQMSFKNITDSTTIFVKFWKTHYGHGPHLQSTLPGAFIPEGSSITGMDDGKGKVSTAFIEGLDCSNIELSDHAGKEISTGMKSTQKGVHKKAKIQCPYENCGWEFGTKSSLIRHLQSVHDYSIQEPQSREFENYNDFKKWKEEEEKRTYSYYSQKCGGHKNSKRRYFYCQKDCTDRTYKKGDSARKTDRRNSKGRVRPSKHCLSSMKVTHSDTGSVTVVYMSTHNHPVDPTDTKHHPLSTDISQYIDDQNAMNRSAKDIYRDLVDKLSAEVDGEKQHSKNLVSLKLIRERKRKKDANMLSKIILTE